MESHAPLDKDINNRLAYIYPKLEKQYNPDGLPSVLVGDMNNYATSEAYKTYLTWWEDAYETLLPSNSVEGPSGTYNGFDTARDMNSAGRIDYIFFRGNIEPVHYVCDNTLYEGYYPSDHLPIYCDFRISTKE
jgi:endonuclease/exonuclease/phosphatase family metal-dependent hydrolase